MALDRSLIGVRLHQPLFRLFDSKRAQALASQYGWFYGFHTGWDLWKGGLSSDDRLEDGQTFYYGEIYPSIGSLTGSDDQAGMTQEGECRFPEGWTVRRQNRFWIGLFIFLTVSKEILEENEQALMEGVSAEHQRIWQGDFRARFSAEDHGYFAYAEPEPKSDDLDWGGVKLHGHRVEIGHLKTRELESLREALSHSIREDDSVAFLASPIGKRLRAFWTEMMREVRVPR